MRTTVHHQGRLCARIIDRINHIIKTTRHNQTSEILFGDKIFNLGHTTKWIDLRNTLGERADLGFAQGISKGMNLAIHIRFREMVQINQRDLPDCAAR